MLVIDYMHMHTYILDSNSDPYSPTVQAQAQHVKVDRRLDDGVSFNQLEHQDGHKLTSENLRMRIWPCVSFGLFLRPVGI